MKGDHIAFRNAVPQFHMDTPARGQFADTFYHMTVACACQSIAPFQRGKRVQTFQLQRKTLKGTFMLQKQRRVKKIKSQSCVFRFIPGAGEHGFHGLFKT